MDMDGYKRAVGVDEVLYNCIILYFFIFRSIVIGYGKLFMDKISTRHDLSL